jgi:hypothetical protein
MAHGPVRPYRAHRDRLPADPRAVFRPDGLLLGAAGKRGRYPAQARSASRGGIYIIQPSTRQHLGIEAQRRPSLFSRITGRWHAQKSSSNARISLYSIGVASSRGRCAGASVSAGSSRSPSGGAYPGHPGDVDPAHARCVIKRNARLGGITGCLRRLPFGTYA